MFVHLTLQTHIKKYNKCLLKRKTHSTLHLFDWANCNPYKWHIKEHTSSNVTIAHSSGKHIQLFIYSLVIYLFTNEITFLVLPLIILSSILKSQIFLYLDIVKATTCEGLWKYLQSCDTWKTLWRLKNDEGNAIW